MKKLVIVGGGSAGWMTALYLNRRFNQGQKNIAIQVIESPDIGIIGVGEATVHSIRFFFAAMGLDEAELMAEANASFKLGILFRNWRTPVAGKPHEYFHPFEHQPLGRSQDISSLWLQSERPAYERYDQGVSLTHFLWEAGRGPKTYQSKAFTGLVPYGYHLDATLLAGYLRRKAIEAGVEHIAATVEQVITREGLIEGVRTTAGYYTGDIFIDCTGFRGLLIDQLAANNWESFADALPCNKAVAIQRELPVGQAPRPYTTATALDYGWAWQIDLVNRQGTGYVYDGNYLSQSQAEAELRAFLGEDSRLLKCTHLDMKVGCRRAFWVGNCIAVGLAGGFIEPLESTGLHLINLGAGLLATHLAAPTVTSAIRANYNRLMRGFYQDLKQFIVLHYCLTDREDTPFWRNARRTLDECPELQTLISVWQHKVCEYLDLAGGYASIFNDENYRYVLYGMGYLPQLNGATDTQETERVFAELAKLGERALAMGVDHGDYLAQLKHS